MPSTKLLHLSGVAAIALVVGSFAAAGTPPATDAPVADVVSFYSDHDTGQRVGAVLLGFGALLLLVFTAALATTIRSVDVPAGFVRDRDLSAATCFAGGVVLCAGFAVFAGLMFALGEVAADIDPAAAQALHVLNQELFYPVTIGTAAFMFGAAGGVSRTGVLPHWLVWAAVLFGVLAVIPSHVLGGPLDHIGFAGFLGLGAWSAVAGVLLARRPATATTN